MTTSPSPSDVVKAMSTPSASQTRYKRDIERARGEGIVEGREQARHEILTFLEERYLGLPGNQHKGDEGKAILELTMALSKFIKTGKR